MCKKYINTEKKIEQTYNQFDNNIIPQIIAIEEKFQKAFDKLPEKDRKFCDKKRMKIAYIDLDSIIHDCSFEESEQIVPVFEDIINTYYLKNRFNIYETQTTLYISAQLSASLKALSMVGVVKSIKDVKKKGYLHSWGINNDGNYCLFRVECNDVKNITQIDNNIYVVQVNDMLIAVQTGIVLETIEEPIENIEENRFEFVECERSYV